jgi:hypothetical protein
MATRYGLLLKKALTDPTLLSWLLGLLACNLLLVVLHAAHYVCVRHGLDAWPRDPRFSLDSNVGFAQLFSSIQTLLLIGLLLQLARRTRETLYLALAAVFLFVLIDDGLAVNQVLGALVVPALGLVDLPRIKAESLGEMVVYGLVAVPLLATVAVTFARATPEHRAAGLGFLSLLALLTFFATVMDLVHLAFINSFRASQLVLEVTEEGGEMLTESLALMLALTLVRRPPAIAPRTRSWPTEAMTRQSFHE